MTNIVFIIAMYVAEEKLTKYKEELYPEIKRTQLKLMIGSTEQPPFKQC